MMPGLGILIRSSNPICARLVMLDPNLSLDLLELDEIGEYDIDPVGDIEGSLVPLLKAERMVSKSAFCRVLIPFTAVTLLPCLLLLALIHVGHTYSYSTLSDTHTRNHRHQW